MSYNLRVVELVKMSIFYGITSTRKQRFLEGAPLDVILLVFSGPVVL